VHLKSISRQTTKNSGELIDTMGSPYLNSGEAIVLTTHRVVVDAVPYDIMLTTERVFLIDNRSARFEPRTLPLATILAVQGGKTPAHEPVITLLFHPQGGMSRQPINLVFSQTPNENRKQERDDWVRNLIRLSISRQEREAVPETPVIREETGGTGLRPTARHGVAPDMVRPLSNVAIRDKVSAPVTVIPEEVEDDGEMPAREAIGIPLRNEEPDPVPEEPVSEITPPRTTSPAVLLPPARVIIPQIIEELLPEKKTATSMGRQEPEPAAALDPEALFRTIPTAVRSMTVTEEQRPSQYPVPETNPEPAAEITTPAAEQEEVPEIIKALRIGATEPATDDVQHDTGTPDSLPEPAPDFEEEISIVVPEQPVISSVEEPEELPASGSDTTEPVTPEAQPDAPIPDTLPEPAPDFEEAIRAMFPEQPVTSSVTGPDVQEPENNPVPDVNTPQETAVTPGPPIRHPIPPAREIRPLRTTLAYAAVLILFIVLAAAGAVLLIPAEPGQHDIPITPTPSIVPVTTSPPAMPLPTTKVATPMPSVTTRTATPVPSVTASPVPQDGVWIRVSSPSEYFGTLGNTGMMRQVSGTGDTFYKVLKNDQPVQVSVRKKDNSGALLTVAIYRNGTLISTRSVTSPMGTVDVLINPVTALAPGLSANDVLPEQTATRAGLEDY
jgi:hypothetical protein